MCTQDVRRIETIAAEVEAQQQLIKEQIFSEFRQLGPRPMFDRPEHQGTAGDGGLDDDDGPEPGGTAARLRAACAVLEVLRPDTAKRELVDWFCDLQLQDYTVVFGYAAAEAGKLSAFEVSCLSHDGCGGSGVPRSPVLMASPGALALLWAQRRFAWLRRKLQELQTEAGGWCEVFPTHWQLPMRIAREFCALSKKYPPKRTTLT